MAGRDLHAGHRAEVPYRVREQWGRERAGEYGGAEAGAGHHGGGVAGEVLRLVAGVVADDDEAAFVTVLVEVRGQAGGGADDDRAVHAHGAGADFAAQAGGAELEGAAEACGELVGVRGVDEPGELVAGLRVRVLGEPCLGPGGEIVVHVGSASRCRWCGCEVPTAPVRVRWGCA